MIHMMILWKRKSDFACSMRNSLGTKKSKSNNQVIFGWFLAQKNVAHLLLWFPKQLGTLGQCNMM